MNAPTDANRPGVRGSTNPPNRLASVGKNRDVTSIRRAIPARIPALVALVAATAVWGSTFVVTKGSLQDLAPAAFLVWRFGIAAVILMAARPARVRALSRLDAGRGLCLGLLLGSGFLLQTTGLSTTDAGLSGFLTGTSVILTPVLAAAFFGASVGSAGWLAVGLGSAGLVLLTRGDGTALSLGAVLTLGGAACFAGHITGLSAWATPANAYGLTAWSVTVAAALCTAVAVVGRQAALPATGATWRSLVYLALVATCLGLGVQAWAQSALTATTAAVVMTMEPVFAAVFAATLGAETLTPASWLGGLLVVSSMFVAELGPRHCCDAVAPRVECC